MYDDAQITDIARRILTMHGGKAYGPYERACDHAFGYKISEPGRQLWLAVADAIKNIEQREGAQP